MRLDAPSGNSPRLNANACPECREDATLLPPVRAGEDSFQDIAECGTIQPD